MPIAYRISQTDFGYTGQRSLGGALGLMDYRARFYDPDLSRFIQPDTLIPNPSNPQAFNRYSYVANRPINFNDPTGHKWDDCGERTGYACKIHMKQVGILKTQWKKEKEAAAAAAREAAIADAMARIEGLDPGIIPSGDASVGGGVASAGDSGCQEDDDLCWLKKRGADNSQPTIPINPIRTPQTPTFDYPNSESSATTEMGNTPNSGPEMCSPNGDACIIGGVLLIIFTDFFVGLPAIAVIILTGGATPPAIAAEALETYVVLPINIFGIYLIYRGIEANRNSEREDQ